MSATDRQNRLLLAEDWKKIYQSFRNADFKSYDFDNLRRTMINYIRQNYPEDFNDYIESSEYLALIDLIAFLGQNISFRVDLNARENYLELAERKESVLRLARLLSYNPKRNKPANGLLKITSVQTSEDLLDSNGINLAGQTVIWNDAGNSNWKEQFTKVFNSALPQNGSIGRPIKSEKVNGITTDKYRLNATNREAPVYSFTKTVNGTSTQFEMTSIDIQDGQFKEESPLPGNSLAFVYREDGKGNDSSNTGYFIHFRQGLINVGDFSVTNPSSNQVVSIDTTNINESDVWLYKLDSLGFESQLWEKVDAVEGNNVIYNSVEKNQRNIYAVQTRAEDRINLIFADGIFGNVPNGNFRIYYRTSANRAFNIKPSDLQNINLTINYASKTGKVETLQIGLALKTPVTNATIAETSSSIRSSAPQTYYTQNRMVTAEDYQIVPLTISQEIIKIKSVNRVASGISRYYDLIDATSKYSSVNLYGKDGAIYREEFTTKDSFSFSSQTDIEGVIENLVTPLLEKRNTYNFYNTKYAKIIVDDLQSVWQQSSVSTNNSTGYFLNINQLPAQVGNFTGGSLKYIEPGALLKFTAPEGKHFMPDGTLMDGPANHPGSRTYIWARVVNVIGNGTEVQSDSTGPISLNIVVPQDAILNEVKPKFTRALTADIKTQFIDQVFAYKTFGLRYDQISRQWRIIIKENLNVESEFNNGKSGDLTNNELDSSWILLFETNGEKYTITTRQQRFIFESAKEIDFYYDGANKVYDVKTGKLIKDKISVLSINTQPDETIPFVNDIVWEVVDSFRNIDGYVDSKKIEVSFYDQNDDGTIDDPDVFDNVVAPAINESEKIIFLKKNLYNDGFDTYNLYTANDIEVVITEQNIGPLSGYNEGQVFYLQTEEVFKVLSNGVLNLTTEYRAYTGRKELKFQYVHTANQNKRIDPSSTNLIDIFMLTKSYDRDFRAWLKGSISTPPLPPSNDELFLNYGQDIAKYKSISDEVIYHSVKYKVLFGEQADPNLRATFKIVKNPNEVVNDNDIKARVISAINRYFALENWDFGEQFNFTEMSTYIMTQVAPDVVSIVIVPDQSDQPFGSMFEIKAESDEIFISGATVDNIEVIDSLTASKLKTQSGVFVNSATSTNTGIQSGNLSTGGSNY